MENTTYDPDLVHAIFKQIWARRASERDKRGGIESADGTAGVGTSKRSRPTSEAIQRASAIAEAEGGTKIEATHLERVLPQLLLDF